MRRLTPVLLLSLLLALEACQPAETEDVAATLAVAQQQIALEETQLSASIGTRAASVSATAYAAETYVVEHNRINQQLLATARFANPPTQQVIALNPGGRYAISTPHAATPDPGVATAPEAPATGSNQFTGTTTARSVRPEDGCPLEAVTTFTTDDAQIYVVTRAVEVSAGTQMAVEWAYEGQSVDTASYNVPTDEQNFCIYFFLDSFSPGNWSVTMTADGAAIANPISFTVTAGDA